MGDEEWVCIVKASRLLVEITVTEKYKKKPKARKKERKKRLYRYIMQAGINNTRGREGGKKGQRNGGKKE